MSFISAPIMKVRQHTIADHAQAQVQEVARKYVGVPCNDQVKAEINRDITNVIRRLHGEFGRVPNITTQYTAGTVLVNIGVDK